MIAKSWLDELKFNEQGLIPVVTQDYHSLKVLMLAWANREALELSNSEKAATYWSRSRNQIWRKGSTSGNTQEIINIYADCDRDSILYLVKQTGNSCHTGKPRCFYNKLENNFLQDNLESTDPWSTILNLVNVLQQRKGADAKSSYSASLCQKGAEHIGRKTIEESVELLLASVKLAEVNNQENRSHVIAEAADLFFHYLLQLTNDGISLAEIAGKLQHRRGVSGILEKNSRIKVNKGSL